MYISTPRSLEPYADFVLFVLSTLGAHSPTLYSPGHDTQRSTSSGSVYLLLLDARPVIVLMDLDLRRDFGIGGGLDRRFLNDWDRGIGALDLAHKICPCGDHHICPLHTVDIVPRQPRIPWWPDRLPMNDFADPRFGLPIGLPGEWVGGFCCPWSEFCREDIMVISRPANVEWVVVNSVRRDTGYIDRKPAFASTTKYTMLGMEVYASETLPLSGYAELLSD